MSAAKQIVCDACGELIDEDKYKRHIRNGHKDKREFRCEICGKEFTSNYNLQYHVAHHLNERSFVCNECPRAYNTSADLVQHQRIHDKQRDPYKCQECNLYFDIKSRFNTHMRIHKVTVKGPKICPICNKPVLDVKRHHETVHMNLRTHECDMCMKKFNKKSGLERHIQTVHEKRKNFVCEICNAAFGEKSLMLRHTRRHSMLKPSFYCTICKKYVNDVQVKEHYEEAHADLPYTCDVCFRKFLKKREWSNHVAIRHTKMRKWLCDLCGKGFIEIYQLKRHFRTHINVDSITEKDVERLIANLDRSKKRKMAPKRFNCKICHKKFKRKDSIERHLEACHKTDTARLKEPAICDMCGASFTKLASLERHVESHAKSVHIKEEHESDIDCYYGSDEENNISDVQIETITIKKELEDFSNDDDNDDDDPWINDTSQNDHLSIKSENETFDDVKPKKEESDKGTKNNNATPAESKDETLQIRCKVCYQIFTTKIEFREHFMTQHAGETETSYECKECHQVFANKKALVHHFKASHERLTCGECGEEFWTKSDLAKHIRKNHAEDEKDLFICNHCGKMLRNERNLKLHIQAIHNNERFECTICSKSFTYKSAMYRHRDREHGKGKVYQCDKCPQKVGTKHELALHTERHHNSMRENSKPEHMCAHCGVCFPSSFVLSRHERRIHGTNGEIDDQRECGICREQFKDFYWKRKHMAQVHLNGKRRKRQCQYCSAEFKLYEDFKNHIESHVGIFICTICGAPFYDLSSLTLHGASHKKIDMKLRKFVCDYCGHRLFTKVQMQQHMLKHIKQYDIHYCEICGKGFKFASSLYTHRKYHGEGEFVCTYCGRKFARNSDLVNHIRSHTNEKPFKCQICNKDFAQKQALYYHHQTHPETRARSECKDCNMIFPDKKQLKFHEEQLHPEKRPFRCFICNMTFKHEHNMRRHNTDKHFKVKN